jgi:hypothetical protein
MQHHESRKDMSLCLAKSKISPLMLESEIGGLERVYCTEYKGVYGSGYLLAMFHSNPSKRHSTLDNCITNLDRIMREAEGSVESNFLTVSDHLSGKVRTFSRGESRHDELFGCIFDVSKPGRNGRLFTVNAGVEVWLPGASEYHECCPDEACVERGDELRGANEMLEKVDAFV